MVDSSMTDADTTASVEQIRQIAEETLRCGIDAAHPQTLIEEHVSIDNATLTVGDERIELNEYEEIVVLGGGNGAGEMAAALESLLQKNLDGGIVCTDAVVEADRIDVREGDHPVPTDRNRKATDDLLARAERATEDTLIIAVITGGGSALLTAPRSGVSISSLQYITKSLLNSGCSVHELNTVRSHLSDIKGGGLVRAASPADVLGLVVSDVVGDDVGLVASGPTVPRDTTSADVRSVLNRYGVHPPDDVSEALDFDSKTQATATEQLTARNVLLATNRTALDAAATKASTLGYRPVILSSQISGEARMAAKTLVEIANECLQSGSPVEPPVALFTGGECTVTVTGDGTGGPNAEFALSAARELSTEEIVVASIDTDGRDGPTDAAGAVVDYRVAAGSQSELQEALDRNNAYPVLADAGCLIPSQGRT
jgi:hydroxypyruvate reductase